MSCYYPLKAWPVGKTDTGKTAYKVTSQNVISMCDAIGDPIDVPCGKCVGCRLAYSRQWADRCMLEAQYHPFSWFITLTYSDDYVPISYYGDPNTGEAMPVLTLRKRDFQLFMKRLRKYLEPEKIRFYACGEYGGVTFRPHYHMILFGWDIPDLKALRFERGHWLYTSDLLFRIWQNGLVSVGELSWETCAYTARYVMKKAMGSFSDAYDRFNIEPEFVLMSRKPGIGFQYYEDHKDAIYKFSSFSIETPSGGRRLRPPQYYDRLYDLDFPGEIDLIKAKRRQSAEVVRQMKLSRTDLSYFELLELEEKACIERSKKLIREEI